MTLDHFISLLNSDLSNEYKHMFFYLQSSFLVEGLHREELHEYLAKHAHSEFEHVQEFAKIIVGLGGIPTTHVNEFPNIGDPKSILEYALKMEEEVVANYVQRMDNARQLSGVDGAFVEIFLENQIQDSRMDADHLKMMVKST